jgi:hypothetical protein
VDDFRSFSRSERRPASAMQPVVDPAGWSASALADVESWSYRIDSSDADELAAGIVSSKRAGIALVDIERKNFPLNRFGTILADVRRELLDGRGIVMLRGFPVDRFSREEQAIAFLGLGAHLGERIPQNKQGHILGHVKDLGGDYAAPLTRGYTTHAEMRFHADASDYVGLLCLRESKSGGASRVASSVTVYNRMLEQRPDLVQALCEDLYRSHTGEVNPGEPGWFKQPIFSFTQGYFSATGAGAAIDKAQSLPGVPPYTPAQKEAVEFYRRTVDECAVDIDFQQGDIQFLNNFVMLHTRREYEDWPEARRKRHLLRLWLTDPNGRPIPKEQREGRSGRGVRLAGVALNAPLDIDVAA